LVVGKEPADRVGPRPPGNSTATFRKLFFPRQPCQQLTRSATAARRSIASDGAALTGGGTLHALARLVGILTIAYTLQLWVGLYGNSSEWPWTYMFMALYDVPVCGRGRRT
jgi:hypothetical protein